MTEDAEEAERLTGFRTIVMASSVQRPVKRLRPRINTFNWKFFFTRGFGCLILVGVFTFSLTFLGTKTSNQSFLVAHFNVGDSSESSDMMTFYEAAHGNMTSLPSLSSFALELFEVSSLEGQVMETAYGELMKFMGRVSPQSCRVLVLNGDGGSLGFLLSSASRHCEVYVGHENNEPSVLGERRGREFLTRRFPSQPWVSLGAVFPRASQGLLLAPLSPILFNISYAVGEWDSLRLSDTDNLVGLVSLSRVTVLSVPLDSPITAASLEESIHSKFKELNGSRTLHPWGQWRCSGSVESELGVSNLSVSVKEGPLVRPAIRIELERLLVVEMLAVQRQTVQLGNVQLDKMEIKWKGHEGAAIPKLDYVNIGPCGPLVSIDNVSVPGAAEQEVPSHPFPTGDMLSLFDLSPSDRFRLLGWHGARGGVSIGMGETSSTPRCDVGVSTVGSGLGLAPCQGHAAECLKALSNAVLNLPSKAEEASRAQMAIQLLARQSFVRPQGAPSSLEGFRGPLLDDVPGPGDLGNLQVSFEQCASLCRKNRRCVSFEYSPTAKHYEYASSCQLNSKKDSSGVPYRDFKLYQKLDPQSPAGESRLRGNLYPGFTSLRPEEKKFCSRTGDILLFFFPSKGMKEVSAVAGLPETQKVAIASCFFVGKIDETNVTTQSASVGPPPGTDKKTVAWRTRVPAGILEIEVWPPEAPAPDPPCESSVLFLEGVMWGEGRWQGGRWWWLLLVGQQETRIRVEWLGCRGGLKPVELGKIRVVRGSPPMDCF